MPPDQKYLFDFVSCIYCLSKDYLCNFKSGQGNDVKSSYGLLKAGLVLSAHFQDKKHLKGDLRRGRSVWEASGGGGVGHLGRRQGITGWCGGSCSVCGRECGAPSRDAEEEESCEEFLTVS